MNDIVIGIDAGGTKLHGRAVGIPGSAVLADQVIDAGNWPDASMAERADRLHRLLAILAPARDRLLAVAVGAHGCDSVQECGELRHELSRRVDSVVEVVNDAQLVPLVLGNRGITGLIAGTGSMAVGRAPSGEILWSGGGGWVLGEEGGAIGLVRQAAHVVLSASTRDDEPEPLHHHLLAALGCRYPEEISDVLLGTEAREWARAAPAVFAAAKEGSEAARTVISGAGIALADMIHGLGRRGADTSVIAVAGGVITKQHQLFDAFTGALSRRVPEAEARLVQQPPVEGAVLLAEAVARGATARAFRGSIREVQQ